MGKIYTKKGDEGETGTFLGRMSKSDALTEAIGCVDELNSWLGCADEVVGKRLIRVQANLMKINAILAGSKIEINNLDSGVRILEKQIDEMTKSLPRINNFIYPTGKMQVVRAVCRRSERAVVRYFDSSFKILDIRQKKILKYLNRLSDYLFTLARWVNWKSGIQEEVWRG